MAGNSASCAGAVGTRETAPAHMVPKAMEARCAVRVPSEKKRPGDMRSCAQGLDPASLKSTKRRKKSPDQKTGAESHQRLGLSRRRPWLSRHTLRKSQCTKRIRCCGQTNGPKVARSAGGDRDDLVDTPALRGGRLVRHGGLLRRQRLGRFFCAGLYDGKSEYRRQHHEVC